MSEKRTYSPMPVFLYALAKLIGGDKVPPIGKVFMSEEEAAARRRGEDQQ